jgi:YHS domain-containing protein
LPTVFNREIQFLQRTDNLKITPMMKYCFVLIASFLCLVSMAQPENAARRRNFNNDNFVAMREFDPVSYFQGKPTKGTSKFSHDYKGIIYYFASEANLEEFKRQI